MKNAIEVLKTRRSIRTYTSQPVERKIIEDIVDCARLAPTAMNDQPWDFIVITGKEDLARLPKILGHGEFIANAAFCVLVTARPSGCAVEDSCAATENLLIAAEALHEITRQASKVGSAEETGDTRQYVVVEIGERLRSARRRNCEDAAWFVRRHVDAGQDDPPSVACQLESPEASAGEPVACVGWVHRLMSNGSIASGVAGGGHQATSGGSRCESSVSTFANVLSSGARPLRRAWFSSACQSRCGLIRPMRAARGIDSRREQASHIGGCGFCTGLGTILRVGI